MISLDDLKAMGRSLDGQILTTLDQDKEFKIEFVEEMGFIFTPVSSGKPRKHQFRYAQEVLKRYNETKSWHPRDYRDITRNASYVLPLIQLVEEKKRTRILRTPIIAGNWKMNTTVAEAVSLVMAMKDRLDAIKGVEKVVCPPFVSLVAVGEVLIGSSIAVGAQNMYSEEKGAYTGEVSALMLAGLCQYVILGHSERRGYFGESDEMINKKIKAALKAGLKPIVCVGETLEENEGGKTGEVITRQVRAALDGLVSLENLVIAYEPIWAIGTGRAATEEQANTTIRLIRNVVGGLYGAAAQELRIQYGGSTNSANIAALMAQPEIDGALVGGASLKADEFVSMVKQTAQAKQRRR